MGTYVGNPRRLEGRTIRPSTPYRVYRHIAEMLAWILAFLPGAGAAIVDVESYKVRVTAPVQQNDVLAWPTKLRGASMYRQT